MSVHAFFSRLNQHKIDLGRRLFVFAWSRTFQYVCMKYYRHIKIVCQINRFYFILVWTFFLLNPIEKRSQSPGSCRVIYLNNFRSVSTSALAQHTHDQLFHSIASCFFPSFFSVMLHLSIRSRVVRFFLNSWLTTSKQMISEWLWCIKLRHTIVFTYKMNIFTAKIHQSDHQMATNWSYTTFSM